MSSRSQPTTSALPPASGSGSSGGVHHKANVLASLQDAYWSDDEAEDNECPLCLEEMDLSDMNFKPCPCGYQICRFCWHHIKTNLNGRCPACRREYTEESVEFKPVGAEDQKRLAQKKRQKEKERKDLDAVGRRHYTNVRIVQRNMIYVTGIGPRFAKEELLPTLRSTEYFGQYGKITKILLVKRPPPSNSASREPVIGLYINYYRREDAARAVAAVDGAPSPSGGGEVMRASYGTTKYCVNFLRGLPCGNQGCLDIHDWADDRDCFTKEDLTTLKHTMKDTEARSRTGAGQNSRKSEEVDRKPASARHNAQRSDGGSAEAAALPKTASWARAGQTVRPISPLTLSGPPPGLQPSQPRTRQGVTRRDPPQAVQAARTTTSTQEVPRAKLSIATADARKATQPAARTSTEALPAVVGRSVPNDLRAAKPTAPQPTAEPLPPSQAARPVAAAPSAEPTALPSPPAAVAPARAPGLEPKASAPGIVASTSSYRLTNSAKALLDDVLALRETAQVSPQSPFPDFDRTLMNLQSGGLSFNLDLNSSSDGGRRDAESSSTRDWSTPSSPMSKFGVTPISIPAASELGRVATPIYSGPFNPFDPPKDDRHGSQGPSIPSSRAQSPAEGEEVRRSSRFDFARRFGTPGSGHRGGLSLSSSPMISDGMMMGSPAPSSSVLSPMHHQQSLAQPSSASNWAYSEYSQTSSQAGWGSSTQDVSHGFTVQSDSFAPQQQNLNSAMLQKMLNIGGGPVSASSLQQRDDAMHQQQSFDAQPFRDPAIMSMQANAPIDPYGAVDAMHNRNTSLPVGPPPGLSGPVTQFANEQGGSYSGSSRSFRLPVGSSASSSQAGAGSPSYNSAMSISANSGDAEAASISLEGEPIDVEDIGESRPLSVNTAYSSQLPHVQSPASIELPPIPIVEDSPVGDTPSQSDADALPLSDSDFPALPASQPVVVAPRRELRRPVIPPIVPKPETKNAASQRKPPAAKQVVNVAISKSSTATKASSSAPDTAQAGVSRAPSVVKAASMTDVKPKASAASSTAVPPKRATQPPPTRPVAQTSAPAPAEPVEHAPILSRKARKNKPPTKIEKKPSKGVALNVEEESEAPEVGDTAETPQSAPPVAPVPPVPAVAGASVKSANRPPSAPGSTAAPLANPVPSATPVAPSAASAVPSKTDQPLPANGVATQNSRPPFVPTLTGVPASLGKMLDEIGRYLDVESSAFFDVGLIGGKGQASIRYAPLVHALSTLSAGSGTFSSALPNSSIDSAVASFQQLLETLTQTISDILHLLPRNTWDDSSSFDGVLRDMLKAEDLLDEMSDTAEAKEDEVATLTMALEKRARWMEHQLTKLEDLHCDINSAAVRAVLSINDRGWDTTAFLPRQGGSLARFDALGHVEITGHRRDMSIQMLEASLAEAKTKEAAAEAEVKQAMQRSTAHLWSLV